ncbi:MAG: [FeFe] hydrogenase H-cluster maturation GTPase HydF, partial [Treponema sp.]|nr:[FeFe] hydrogenase H-cluster maturation GTPase HydF [Treponema sp.]
RNAGKSSLVNALAGQQVSIVSAVKGTTADPVRKAMELLPAGPVVLIDTPGMDDAGELGSLRAGRAMKVSEKTDVAVIVIESGLPPGAEEEALAADFVRRGVPFIVARSKSDAGAEGAGLAAGSALSRAAFEAPVSALCGEGLEALREKIAGLAAGAKSEKRLVADLIKPGDIVVLVAPIDASAPKGRLILPQQQVARDILDAGAMALFAQDGDLRAALASLREKPALVITDSQAFALAAAETPSDVPLTSFSILFARLKGDLEGAVRGADALDGLRDGDRLLICEGCTHKRQCDDIGTVKLPRMIREFAKAEPAFDFCSGGDFPEDLSPYKAIIHCGGCMLSDGEMRQRRRLAEEQGAPFTNYGIVIAKTRGILARAVAALLPGR